MQEEALGGSEAALLESMLRQLAGGDGNGVGASDMNFEGMMETMLEQLMSKDVLYEPIKELADQFPPWLAKNKQKLDPSEYKRYESQLACCRQMVAIFESVEHVDQAKITTLMQEMQDYGQPPQDLVGQLAPGLEFAADGQPKMNPDDCRVQ